MSMTIFELNQIGKGVICYPPTIATVNNTITPYLLLKNPVGSNVKVIISEWMLQAVNTAFLSLFASFFFYRNPTITANGTLQTNLLNKSDSLYVPKLQIYSAPTISANGTIKSTTTVLSPDSNYRKYEGEKLIMPGENILLSVFTLTGAPAGIAQANVMWAEDNYGL